MMTLSDPIVSTLTQVSVFSLAKGLLRTSHETELGPLRRNKLLLYSYRVEIWGEEVEAVRAWIRQSTIDIVNSSFQASYFPFRFISIWFRTHDHKSSEKHCHSHLVFSSAERWHKFINITRVMTSILF